MGLLDVPGDPASLFPPFDPMQLIAGGQGMAGPSAPLDPGGWLRALQALHASLRGPQLALMGSDPAGHAGSLSQDSVAAPANFNWPTGQGAALAPTGLPNSMVDALSTAGPLGSRTQASDVPAREGFDPAGFTSGGAPLDHGGQSNTIPAGSERPSAASRPTANPLPPPLSAHQKSIATQIDQAAADRHVSLDDRLTLAGIAYAESRLDPTQSNGRAAGLFQFQPATFVRMGGTDIKDTDQQVAAAADLLASDKASLTRALKAPPTSAQLYIAHQQGPTGSIALLTAPPGETAVDALIRAGLSPHAAELHIVRNGGQPGMLASDFVNNWTRTFNSYLSLLFPPPSTGGGAAPLSPIRAPAGS
jgi:hypothetical protein